MDKQTSQLQANKLFFKLTLQLEIFTHIVPVPVAIYFSMVAGGFETTDDLLLVGLMGFIGGGLMVLWGVIWRYMKLKPIMKSLQILERGEKLEDTEARELKLKLLKQPFLEARIIASRWLIGVPFVHLLFILFGGLRPKAHLSLPFLLLMIVPISYIAFLFLSENIIRPYLQSFYFRSVRVNISDVPRMSYFRRLLLVIFSLAIMPITLFSYLLFAITQNIITLENPLMHISIIVSTFILPIVIAAYAVANAVKSGLSNINYVLEKVGEGDLDTSSVVASSDEFGEQAYHLGIVVDKLKKMYAEINDLNANLENKVAKRTEALKRTVEEIRNLKVQQDGDYFLTSLLLKPLSFSHVSSKHIEVDFFIRQKKHFTFRKWSEEIGGDLCCADELTLNQKKYLVFANADAMGKSMQGAGGALVFGAVFQAIIERSKIYTELQNNSPELWLRNAFIEIHKIFETFDGSMLISSVFGLVDVETGFVYYMNSEHPDPILYRNGKASFLPDVHPFRKFGTTGVRGLLFVQTFQLKAGDMLWIGSDGKDDINLADPGATRIINHDETLFLRILEIANANYDTIVSELEKKGEITDDLSLLSITFKKNLEKDYCCDNEFENEIRQLRKSAQYNLLIEKIEDHKTKNKCLSFTLHKWLAEVYLKKKNYKKAALTAMEFSKEYPSDEKMYLLACIAFKKSGDFKSALGIAKSLRMRNPRNFDYINQLIELLIITDEKTKAKKLLERVLNDKPDNAKALRLQKRL